MQASQLQSGVAIQQPTQGDLDTNIPDGSLGVEKLSHVAVVSLTNYDAIVGNILSNVVQYTSIQTAINATAVDGRILILPGTYPVSVTLNKRVYIVGQGFGTAITGTFTCQAGCIYSSIIGIHCAQFIFNAGANGNIVQSCFVTTINSDSGTGNMINEMVL